LAAYIQAVLTDPEFGPCSHRIPVQVVNEKSSSAHENVSALGAVMAFLYSSYIVINAVLSAVLGKVIDKDFTEHNNIIYSLKMVGGYVFHFSFPLSNLPY